MPADGGSAGVGCSAARGVRFVFGGGEGWSGSDRVGREDENSTR